MKMSLLKGRSGKLHLRLYSMLYLNFDGPQFYLFDFCTVKNFGDEEVCVRKPIRLYSK